MRKISLSGWHLRYTNFQKKPFIGEKRWGRMMWLLYPFDRLILNYRVFCPFSQRVYQFDTFRLWFSLTHVGTTMRMMMVVVLMYQVSMVLNSVTLHRLLTFGSRSTDIAGAVFDQTRVDGVRKIWPVVRVDTALEDSVVRLVHRFWDVPHLELSVGLHVCVQFIDDVGHVVDVFKVVQLELVWLPQFGTRDAIMDLGRVVHLFVRDRDSSPHVRLFHDFPIDDGDPFVDSRQMFKLLGIVRVALGDGSLIRLSDVIEDRRFGKVVPRVFDVSDVLVVLLDDVADFVHHFVLVFTIIILGNLWS